LPNKYWVPRGKTFPAVDHQLLPPQSSPRREGSMPGGKGKDEPDRETELRYELLADLMGSVGAAFSLEALIWLLDCSFFSGFCLVFLGLVCVFCGFLDSSSGDYLYGSAWDDELDFIFCQYSFSCLS